MINGLYMLLLLLLSHFSHVRLCVTPQTAAHQAPPSLGFSRQEHWSGLPFPSPKHESEKWKWSRSVMSDSQRPHGLQPTRLLRPWDFPGKSTGVGCHCLLQYLTIRFSNCAPWYLLKWVEKLCPHKNFHIKMFLAAWFIVVETWKQPRYPLVSSWINKLWYIQTVEYFSVLNRDELSSHEKTWRTLKCILLTKWRKPIPKRYILYYSNYIPFWNRQNCGEHIKSSVVGGQGSSGDMNRQSSEDF